MKTINLSFHDSVPYNFTGRVISKDGTVYYFKNDKYHREDGPAIEWTDKEKWWFKEGKYYRLDGPAIERINGANEWWIDDKQYFEINLDNFVVLDHYKGEYDIMWYKLLSKDKVLEYPDIPGLITK